LDVQAERNERPATQLAIVRGGLMRCPNCGKGKLFRKYLVAVAHCSFCREPYDHLQADDAPPWLTILLVGHIIVPSIIIVDHNILLALWAELLLWTMVTGALTLMLLPRCKGVMLAMLWATKAQGSELPK
jgi:uncharacterized protein (DUF983 family)